MPAKPLFSWRHGILESGLPATTRHVLLTLSCHMTDVGDSCFPSTRTIARETGLSQRAVIKHIRQAREAGWLQVRKRRARSGEWHVNQYLVALPSPCARDSVPPPSADRGAPGDDPDDDLVVNEGQHNSTRNSTRNPTGSKGPSPTGSGPTRGSRGSQQYTDEFEKAWRALPKRAGNNPKRAAFRAWQARIREGTNAGSLINGANRYSRFIQATGKEGGEHVLRGSTFFGPDRHWEQEFDLPAPNGNGNHELAARGSSKTAQSVAALESMRRGGGTRTFEGKRYEGDADAEEFFATGGQSPKRSDRNSIARSFEGVVYEGDAFDPGWLKEDRNDV